MKILVPFKRVPDPASGLAFGSQDTGSGTWIVNPFDEIALEEGLRIRERGEAAEIVGVTIGTAAAEEQIRAALAMGLDRALRVEDARLLDAYTVARILLGVVRREHPGLVLMGKQAVDDDSNQVGQMLAGLLGWPQATFVSKVEFLDGARLARCTRETDRGLEVLSLTLPAVITTDLRLNEPRYVALPALMKARRRPIEVLSATEVAGALEPPTQVLRVSPTPRRTAGVLLESVDELVVRLRDHDKVL